MSVGARRGRTITASAVIPPGKLPADLLGAVLGAAAPLPPEVLVGPRVGEDACAIELGGQVLVAGTDPITLTGTGAAAYAVQINANDVAVMGVRPRWFLATVLLPRGTTRGDVVALFDELHEALARLEVALVGGHTEVTAAVTQTVVVGQMLGVGRPAALVTTAGARAGDVVMQVGRAPLEGAAIVAASLADRLTGVEPSVLARARAAADGDALSVVEAALRAVALGATSMHDPTESGLSGGLYELAAASGLQVRLDERAVLWFGPALTLCAALAAEPFGLLASGTLLACFGAAEADRAERALRDGGHEVARIGVLAAGRGVLRADGRPLERFERDELARLLDAG